MSENIQVVYVKPPADGALPDPETCFEIVRQPFQVETVNLKPNQVLVKNLYLSLDPYHRFGLYDPDVTKSQFPVTQPGTIISTYGISEVVRSNNPTFAPGELLHSWVRWETFTIVDEQNLQYLHKVSNDVDPVYYLGPLGDPGLTGYGGLTQIGKPQPGETIVVPASLGTVGSVVGQTAKQLGLRVVGMASSDTKMRYLVDEFGFDAAFNYKQVPSFDAAFTEHCPNGIDIFFDLVGGEILDAALPHMNLGGRIPSAGMVSQYNVPHKQRYGVKNLHSIVGMDITIQSFRNTSYQFLMDEMRQTLTGWLKDGRLKFKVQISEGIETIPTAFYGMFTGGSFGKTVAKVL